MIFAVTVGKGTVVRSVQLNGENIPFTLREYPQNLAIETEIFISHYPLVIEIHLDPAPELLPIIPLSQRGDSNNELKMCSLISWPEKIELTVEGRAGQTYWIRVWQAGKIKSIGGATLQGDKIEVIIPPDSQKKEFRQHRLTIFTQ